MSGGIFPRSSTVQGHLPTVSTLAIGEIAVNSFDGRVFVGRNNGSSSIVQVNPAIQHFASDWQPVSGLGPVESYEYDERVLLFSKGLLQAVTTFVRVPSSYLAGSQINMNIGHYTPGIANYFQFLATSTLVRQGTDAVTSTTNTYSSTNAQQAVNGTANVYTQVTYDLTSTTGQINSVSVNPGDIIKIKLQRIAPTGTDDTNDNRILPGTTEIIFS